MCVYRRPRVRQSLSAVKKKVFFGKSRKLDDVSSRLTNKNKKSLIIGCESRGINNHVAFSLKDDKTHSPLLLLNSVCLMMMRVTLFFGHIFLRSHSKETCDSSNDAKRGCKRTNIQLRTSWLLRKRRRNCLLAPWFDYFWYGKNGKSRVRGRQKGLLLLRLEVGNALLLKTVCYRLQFHLEANHKIRHLV